MASHAAFQEWKDGSRTPDVANRIADVFGFPTGHRELDDKLREWNDWDKNDARSGKVSFLPAVPNPDSNAPKCQLTLDIATPHHPEYYQGKRTEATDDEEPIPLTFPVVKAGAEFLFRIVPLNGATDKVLEDAQKWLLQALAVFGLGAKTAAGMGWFEDVTQKRLEERKALAERQKEQAAQQAQAQQVRDAEARRAQDNKDFEERLARLSPAERAFEKMRNEYPNTDKLMGGMEKLASPKCTWTDDDKKAFIRLVKEGFPPYWTNTLNPLINRKPKKGEQRLKQLAMALVQTDLNMHGKEGRLLK